MTPVHVEREAPVPDGHLGDRLRRLRNGLQARAEVAVDVRQVVGKAAVYRVVCVALAGVEDLPVEVKSTEERPKRLVQPPPVSI